MAEIFISYVQEDSDVAYAIADGLETAGSAVSGSGICGNVERRQVA